MQVAAVRSKKLDSLEPLALLMCEWRSTAIDIVKAHLTDESQIKFIESFVLDMIAVDSTHDDSTSQASLLSMYVLAAGALEGGEQRARQRQMV
eukprot:5200047-Prymnesium_polylepis.1